MSPFVALVPVALLVAVTPTAGGKPSAASVNVTITRVSCSVSPRTIDAGAAIFRIANRSGRSATFSVDGRRARVAPGRATRLALSLRAGRVAYSCTVAQRRVGRGFLQVTAPPQPVAEHRIGVREVNGFGEFYDRTAGAKFVPRGHEYARLGPQQDIFGKTFTYFTTFNVGRYNAERMDAALGRMVDGGYNVITVGINAQCAVGCAADPVGGRLSAEYLANVADFLRRAKAHGVYVMLGTQFIVEKTEYANLINAEPRDLVDNVNLILLTQGGVRAYAMFWTDVIRELRRQGAPLDAIFAYELWDEISFTAEAKPFTLSTGTLRAPNGRIYDLASADDRRRMMDDSLVYWVDQIRAAIRDVDPTALVTVALFQPQEPNATRVGDPRILSTRGAIERSSADFVDIHAYPGIDLSLPHYMENFGVSGPTPKPLVMGEFGAFKFAYPSPAAAVPALLAWQRDSCRYGIDGWLLWTWDTDEQPELWNALSGGGIIEQGLAPKNRADPCA